MVETTTKKMFEMLKQVLYLYLIVLYPVVAYCDSSEDVKQNNHLSVPLVQYDDMNLTSHRIQSTSAGLLLNREDVKFTGIYTQHEFNKSLSYDFPNMYHSIDTLLEVKNGRNQYIVILKSDSDQPISGGLSTLQAGAVYGKKLINNSRLSLVLGGGIAIGDFGIEVSDGEPWPVIPVPLVRMNYHPNLLDLNFEFLTSPNLNFTIAPKKRIRFTGDFRIDQMRDSRDIIFETNLVYRIFNDNHKLGDFAGVSIGFKNDNVGPFALENKDKEETVEVHYYSVFVTIDLSIIKLSVGRAFDGRLLYREDIKQDIGEGNFISVQGMIPLPL
ncbi:hypothetical protein HY745_14405 [Candidatus Desantisbacteria bacterium]|nr:hypothetical protein [Candidatus Desantisbacteria bacterium]